MNLFIELNNLSSKYRFYPKKGSKTHFITNKDLIQKTVFLAELKKSDKVFEINAGEFFIARELAQKSSLTVFEQRKELIKLIQGELQKTKLISSSFLSFSKKLNEKKVVSFLFSDKLNEIFMKLFSFDLNLMVLILQKDFSRKILAEPGFAEYNALTVLTNTFFEIKEVIEVKSDSFYPRTSSDFYLMKFVKKKKIKIKNKEEFFEFVKALFRFKNRVFAVALKKSLGLMKLNEKTKNKIKERINGLEFKDNKFFRKKLNQNNLFQKKVEQKQLLKKIMPKKALSKTNFKKKFNQKTYLLETEDFIELFSLLTE